MSEINVKIIKCDSCGGIIPGKFYIDQDKFINLAEVKAKNFEKENLENNTLDFCFECWKHYVRRARGRIDVIELINAELGFNITEYEVIGCSEEELV